MSEAELALSDDDLDRFIADPVLITTHDQAVEVLDALDAEIADIQAKVDACQIEHSAKQMPPETSAWLRRASYAAAMRRNARHRVMQRDKELRGTKNWGGKPKDPDKKEANIVKQKRLADEVAIRRVAKQSDLLRLQNDREALAQKRREFQTVQNGIYNQAVEKCASKLDEMEAKAREDQQDDKDTYESLHRAEAFHFAARVLRGMKS